jgi:hypothetical protein
MSSVLKKLKKTGDGDEKTVTIKYCASVVSTPIGYLAVVFESTQDPAELLQRIARGEDVPGVGGPFATEDEAKRCGSAVLTEMQNKLQGQGLKSYRGKGEV